MNKTNVLYLALAAFSLPVLIVLFVNRDKLFEEDRSRGTLLYFTSPS